MAEKHLRLNQMLETLKAHHFRITPQRIAVLRILALSDGHPSVEQIYETVQKDFPTTSLATIYKTVNLFKSMGEVLELDFGALSNRYDGNKPYPHPHVICTRCGRILDPEYAALQHLSNEFEQTTGFHITHHRLDFYGLCPQCQKKK